MTVQALRPPGTSLQQSIEMQDILERRLLEFPRSAGCVLQDRHPGDCVRSYAAQHFRYLCYSQTIEVNGPTRSGKNAALLEEWEETLEELPGQIYEVTQPIQMRFNELISGVRSDLGIMVFGEDLDQLAITAQEILEVSLKGIEGAADARVEQTAGLPMLNPYSQNGKCWRATA